MKSPAQPDEFASHDPEDLQTDRGSCLIITSGRRQAADFEKLKTEVFDLGEHAI
jgi:hypothetical protein